MANEVTPTTADAAVVAGAPPAARPTAKKKGALLGGGLLSLVALAWLLSIVAVPSGRKDEHPTLGGPFMADVSPSAGFQVNLAGDGGKHYLSLKLSVEVDAFDESYAAGRASQPLDLARLTDAVLRTASQKTKGELDSAVGREVFREELRVALDPVLFPVHVGDAVSPTGAHEASGLRAGRSITKATLRGLFHDHVLRLDVARRTVRLDDGAEVAFRGDEEDLLVPDARGRCVYVDVSGIHPDWRGDVPVGTFGRVRNVYFGTFLTQ